MRRLREDGGMMHWIPKVKGNHFKLFLSRLWVSRSVTVVWDKILAGQGESDTLAKNVIYWSKSLPFSETRGVVGALDYIRLKNDKTILIRGWIFLLHGKAKKVHVSLEHSPDSWHQVWTNCLSRYDVGQIFSFVPQALNSGFVMKLDSLDVALGQKISMYFRLVLNTGEIMTGRFEAITVTPALSE